MRKILRAEGSEIRCVCGFIRGSPGWSSALLPLCGSDAIPPGATVRSDLHRLITIGIICTVPIMARWKKLIMWKKHPFIIRADNDQESHHDHYSLDGYRWLKNDIIRGNFQPVKNYG